MPCREGVSESCGVLEPSRPRPIAVEDFRIELPGIPQSTLDVDRPTHMLGQHGRVVPKSENSRDVLFLQSITSKKVLGERVP